MRQAVDQLLSRALLVDRAKWSRLSLVRRRDANAGVGDTDETFAGVGA
jgi:hypothetical protein